MPRRATRPRFDTLLEDHAELRARDLNARGIFEANFGEIFVFHISGKEVRIRYLDEQKVVFVGTMTNRNVVDQAFPVKRVLNNFGYKYFFICDRTLRPVTALYLDRDRFRSRHSLQVPYASEAGRVQKDQYEAEALGRRLIGKDGRGPARGANRDRVVKRLQALESRGALIEPDALRAVQRHLDRPAAPVRKPRQLSREVSTKQAAALRRRKGYYSPSLIIGGMLDEIRAVRVRPPAEPTRALLQGQILSIDRYPCLSMPELTRMMPRGSEEIWAEAFRWETKTLGKPLEALIAVDRRAGRRFALVRSYLGDGERQEQVLEIAAGGQKNPKYYFVCPVTGARADTLYYRHGRFASAKAQRLIHASQRGKTSIWRPNRIR